MPIPHGSFANIGGEHQCVLLTRLHRYVGYDPMFVQEAPSPSWTGLPLSRGPYIGRICRILCPWWSCGSRRLLGMCGSSPVAFSFDLVIWPRSSSSILPPALVPVHPGGTSRQWMWMWLVLSGVAWTNRLRWISPVSWIHFIRHLRYWNLWFIVFGPWMVVMSSVGSLFFVWGVYSCCKLVFSVWDLQSYWTLQFKNQTESPRNTYFLRPLLYTY